MEVRSAPFRNELGGQQTPKPRDLPAVLNRIHSSQPKAHYPPPPLPPRRFQMNPFQNHNPPPRWPPSNPFRPNPNPFQQNAAHNNPFRQTQFHNPFRQTPQKTRAHGSGPQPTIQNDELRESTRDAKF